MKPKLFFCRMLLLVVMTSFMMIAGPAVPAFSAAHTAKITIHNAACDLETDDPFGECHDHRIRAQFNVAGVWRTTNWDGVVSWGPGAGTRKIIEHPEMFDVYGYVGAYVFCSNQVTGAVLWDGLANADGTGAIIITTTAGQPVICDWYNLK